jgi:hypothetical protein
LGELPILQDNSSKRRSKRLKKFGMRDHHRKKPVILHLREKEIETFKTSRDTLKISGCSITCTDLITDEYF